MVLVSIWQRIDGQTPRWLRLVGWLGVLVASVAAASFGDWSDVGSALPIADAATYFMDAATTAHGDVVWRGYFSVVSLGHPGPVLTWILAAGMLGARMVGAPLEAGAVVAYTAACVSLVYGAAWFARRAFDSVGAGVGVITATLGFGAYIEHVRHGQSYLATLTTMPLYAPAFGAYLTMAGSMAAVAATARWRPGRWWAAGLGAAMVLFNTSLLLPGVVIAAAGVWAAAHDRWSRTHQVRDAARGAGAGVLVIAAVWAPFWWRMATEGIDLPLRYLDETRSWMGAGGATPLGFLDTLRFPWTDFSDRALIAAIGLTIAACVVLCSARRHRRAGVMLSALLTSQLVTVALAGLGHRAAGAAAVLVTHIGVPVGLVIGAGCAAIARRLCTERAGRGIGYALAVAVMLVVPPVLHNSTNIPARALTDPAAESGLGSVIDRAMHTLDTTADRAARVGVLFLRATPYVDAPLPIQLAEILYAVERTDHNYCLPFEASGVDGNLKFDACEPLLVDTWLVFAAQGTLDHPTSLIGTVYETGKSNSQHGYVAFDVHLTTDLATLGYTQCVDGAGVPISAWVHPSGISNCRVG